MVRAMASRRNELTEAKDLYDANLIRTPALAEIQAKAVARYQADVEEYREEKKEKKKAALETIATATHKEGEEETVTLPEFRRRKEARSSRPLPMPSSAGRSSSGNGSATVEDMLKALTSVFHNSSTRLRTSDGGESARAAADSDICLLRLRPAHRLWKRD